MADPREDRIIDAIADPNLTVESDGDRVTRRSVKELTQALDVVQERVTGRARPFAVIRQARYEE